MTGRSQGVARVAIAGLGPIGTRLARALDQGIEGLTLAEIAEALRWRADIGEDDPFDVGVGLAAAVEPYRGQPQALAIDLGHRTIAAGRGAANIGPVRAYTAKPQEPVAEKRRSDDIDGALPRLSPRRAGA